jgi:two-component system cell cycle response regulator CpdR
MATVLLVDDDVGVRKITATVLALSGHDVCDAADGMGALAILAERQIDLMVLDLAAGDGRLGNLPRSAA